MNISDKKNFSISKSSIILALILALMSIFSLFLGVIDIDLQGLISFDRKQCFFLLESRIPRLLAILCTGVGLSIAGLIMQQLCMNKFISPTTGATISSAELGILIALIFIPKSNLVSRGIFAFIFALLGSWIFVAFIMKIRFKDIVMVPLVGIMFSDIIRGITSFIAYKFDMTQALSSWLAGHFSLIMKGNYEILYLVLPLSIAAFVFSNYFNIVGMGKDFSSNLGLNYNFVLFSGLTLAAALTASIVVTVGSISYVGLIIPNIVTMFKGDRLKGTLVDTALFGAIFVLACDILARLIIFPYELPINLISGIAGSIIFIILLFYRLKKGRKRPVFRIKK